MFVANLPPYVNEQSLGMFFARVGPVGSVRIFIMRAFKVYILREIIGQNYVAPG